MLSKSKFAGAALAAIVLASGLVAGTGQAQAHKFHRGFHGGFGWGGGFHHRIYHYNTCRWAPRFNVYGDYIGSVRACPW
ncbi:MAG: hypothetical protein ACXWVK_10670 [Rhodoplanes sp.]